MNDGPKKLTDRQEAFLEALLGDARGNVRQAMRTAGYSDSTRTSEAIAPIKDEIVDRASMLLASNAPKAAFGILGVLDDPSAVGARNAVAGARGVLDRSGLVKKEQVEVKGVEGGIFILPPKKTEEDGLG